MSYKNRSAEDYFIAGRNINWITAMFSIVATETSVLTFISIPSLAYRGDWYFLQIAFGYIIGRVLVSIFLLPKYFQEGIQSIYEILGKRFGTAIQKVASGLFSVTRILADGIRFLAVAIIVQVVTSWSIVVSLSLIGLITIIYSTLGGIRTIIRIDAVQFLIYLSGGLTAIIYILVTLDITFYEILGNLSSTGKLTLFHFKNNLIFDPRSFIGALIGGALLSFASHGVDYMMVQRVLSTANLKSARKALIGSGLFVFVQFSIFLLIGSLIYVYNNGVILDTDREFPLFIANSLPIGVKGLLLAGLLSSAMSTLSSSINSLASSTVSDWIRKKVTLRNARFISLLWAMALLIFALMFNKSDEAIVIIALQIASFTYGGLLGLFILVKFNIRFYPVSLIAGLLVGIIAVVILKLNGIAWIWFIGISVIVNLITALSINFLVTLVKK
ncbi:sodium:solute symporter [Candidatus Neomarinimicrobiota bacterium]